LGEEGWGGEGEIVAHRVTPPKNGPALAY
jgi:hypothetical protein